MKALDKTLQELGQKIRERRKHLKVSSVLTAEAAGLSRVTLYRIEKGEPSVAMGAYLAVILSLGLKMELTNTTPTNNAARLPLPSKIRVGDYKQLKRIAWQIKKTKELSPKDALDLYERNWRHVDTKNLDALERSLIEALLASFGREKLLV